MASISESAFSAAAACLGIVCYFIDCGKVVFNCYLTYLVFSHIKTLADDFFFRLCRIRFTSVIGYRSLQGLSSHDRTVHLLIRKPSKKVGDVLVCDL